MPDLSITVPSNDAHVAPLQPFLVAGQASDVGPPEPHQIDTVTGQVDAGPVVDGGLAHVPGKTLSLFRYAAGVAVTDGTDPHSVTVTAVNDDHITGTRRVQVFSGPIFHAAAPAVLSELLSRSPWDA